MQNLYGYLYENLSVDANFIAKLQGKKLLAKDDASQIEKLLSKGGRDALRELLVYIDSFYDKEYLGRFCDALEEYATETSKGLLSTIAKRIRKEMERVQCGNEPYSVEVHQDDDGPLDPTAFQNVTSQARPPKKKKQPDPDFSVMRFGGNQRSKTIGLAVVVTLDYDWEGSQLKHLIGTDVDADNWRRALTTLRFDVRVVKNKEATAGKIQEMVDGLLSVELNGECKYLAFVFAGHGSKDSIYSQECVALNVEESILDPLIYSEKRQKQKKLFFFDCCRVHPSEYLQISEKEPQEGTRGAVRGSEYFIAYATLDYTKARESASGGYFSSTVTKWIVKDKSLSAVFNTVSKKMNDKYQQVPKRITTIVGSINLNSDALGTMHGGDVSSSDSEDALDKGTHVDTSPKIRQRFKNNNTGNVEHTSHVPKYPYLGTVNQNASTSYPAQNVLPTLPHEDPATLVYLVSIVLLLVTVVIVILSGYAMTGWLGAMVLVPLFTCIYLVNVSRQG